MPVVPTILSNPPDVPRDPTVARQDDFYADSSAIGQGLLDLGRGVAHVASARAEVEERAKVRDENTWVTSAFEQEKMTLNEYLARPENHTSETYAQDFLKFARSRIPEVQKVAPSSRSSKAAAEHLESLIGRKYEQALQVQDQTRQANDVLAIDDQITSALAAYRDSRGTPGSNSLQDITESFYSISSNIDLNFDKFPKIRAKLKEALVVELANGTMTDSPEFARSLVAESQWLDERTRRALLKDIDQARDSVTALQEFEFAQSRADALVSIEHGKSTATIPLREYERVYGKDRGTAEKARDNYLANILVKTDHHLDRVRDRNPQAQAQMIAELPLRTKEDEEIYQNVVRQVKASVKLAEEDPSEWLRRNNPEVEAAQKRLSEAPDAEKPKLRTVRNATVLKFQGYPPKDAPDADRYLSRPSNDRHLLSTREAEELANGINMGRPDEALAKLDEVMAAFPDDEHRAVAFNDLVTLPPRGRGISQEYQLAIQNRNAPWVDSYISALRNPDVLSKLTGEKKSEINTMIEGNADWAVFRRALLGDGFQRGADIEGYRNGVMAMTQGLILGGRSPKEAVRESINKLINESLAFASVNGEPLVIPRETRGPDPRLRTDQEVDDISRRLSVALREVDPRRVHQGNFPALRSLGKPDDIGVLQALRDKITQSGHFQPTSDGQGATLYMMDDDGRPFQVTDGERNPFTIMYDDLPDFTYRRQALMTHPKAGALVPPTPVTVPQRPERTYDLTEESGWKILGTHRVRTNWPSGWDRLRPNLDPTNPPPSFPPR